ncbi:RQC domain-containing protein, partial [Nocardia sp. NPDC059091]|uniref:RQC domain-containing protein n=1 Tax=Nocardia sp. NPDC059091 TaxID=3346724 RepID=UPI0036987461
SGRGGRDGLPADAWMVYGLGDVVSQRRLIESGEGDQAHKRRVMAHLDSMLALCETVDCRRVQLLRYFDEESAPCGNCDTCLTPPATWDATVAVQKLLSTVIRLDRERGQRFGSGQVIDVLRGNANDRSRASDHESLSVWGVGADLSEGEWKAVIRQSLARGLLESHGDYGVLVLGPAADAVLRGQTEVSMRVDPVKKSGGSRSGSKRRGGPEVSLDPADSALFEALRSRGTGEGTERARLRHLPRRDDLRHRRGQTDIA